VPLTSVPILLAHHHVARRAAVAQIHTNASIAEMTLAADRRRCRPTVSPSALNPMRTPSWCCRGGGAVDVGADLVASTTLPDVPLANNTTPEPPLPEMSWRLETVPPTVFAVALSAMRTPSKDCRVWRCR